MMRDGFREIAEGWTRVQDWDALTDHIERLAEWAVINGLQPDEAAEVRAMLELQRATVSELHCDHAVD
jgi:hypothetical protein